MKNTKRMAYPVYIYHCPEDSVPYYVEIPDFDRGTQGYNLAEALEMAEDLINDLLVTYQDRNEEIPEASTPESLHPEEGAIISWVLADPVEYRRKKDNRAIRKNVSLPSWLNYEAEQAGISFSAILQEGLKEALGITSKP